MDGRMQLDSSTDCRDSKSYLEEGGKPKPKPSSMKMCACLDSLSASHIHISAHPRLRPRRSQATDRCGTSESSWLRDQVVWTPTSLRCAARVANKARLGSSLLDGALEEDGRVVSRKPRPRW